MGGSFGHSNERKSGQGVSLSTISNKQDIRLLGLFANQPNTNYYTKPSWI